MIKVVPILTVATLMASASLFGSPVDADALRGEDFFRTQNCLGCHGKGAKAPDLAQRFDRSYTPAGIAARMWSHAPTMWASMTQQNIALPSVTKDQAADLFAFFYSVRYFERAGEAERGKKVFEAKHCNDCHSLTASGAGPGTPVEKWASLSDPIVLVERMWNHADSMKGEMASRKVQWPQFTSQELDDLLVYLQNLPQTRSARLEFVMPVGEGGADLFRTKGCTDCHKGALALENRLGDSTLTDIAAAMWNHAPQMRQPHPALTLPEMRQILGYVWAKQFFRSNGETAKGRKIFEARKCTVCHDERSSGAPTLAKGAEPYSAITMVAVLWKHGPSMLRQMQDKHIAWPKLTQSEMANLIAYLNSR